MSELEWRFRCSMSLEKEHVLNYQAKYKDRFVVKVVETPCKWTGAGHKFGKAKTGYCITGDKRRFKSEAELIEAVDAL